MNKIFTLIVLFLFLSQITNRGKGYTSKSNVEINRGTGTLYLNTDVLDEPIGSDTFYDPAKVEIYPNPFDGKFMLNLTNFPLDKLTINIYDYIGNSVFSTVVDNRASNNSYEVDVTRMQLRPGIFFLKIEARGLKTKVVRLVKQ